METFQDRDTFYHDKPTVNGEPSSNNGYIYTAYARYLAPNTVNMHKVLSRYVKCTKSLNPVMITRLPGKEEPPFSKDEVVGAVSMGLLTDNELSNSHYNFSSQDIEFERKLSLKSIFRAVKALYKIRKEHRNYVWKNKIVDAYPLAFRLPPEDIYYVQKFHGKDSGLFNTIMFYLGFLSTYLKGDKSSRMMLFLKLNDLNHPLKRIIPYKKWVRNYFPENHPFVRNLK